jgi:hypothetical protein
MRPEKEAATAGTVAVERKTKTTTILYLLERELQSLLWLFYDPLVPVEEKSICEPLIVSTILKIFVLRSVI